MTYCLVPMTVNEIKSLVGKNFVKTFQKEMDEYLAPYRKNVAKGRPLSMGKELWEYAVADSIKGAEWCGAGKSIIDVRIGDNVGIDVKSVSKELKSTATTEASMFQTFQEETKAYFNASDTKSIWELFIDGWLKKVKSVKEYYLIGIVREKETLNCSLCCFKVENTDLLYEDTACVFTSKSMKVQGIGNPEFLETRVYSSKTRLEIKFKNKVWQDSNYCLPIYKF
jgi:hypothetical protein